MHDSSFGKSIEDSTDISSSSTRVTFHDTAVLHYDDGRSPTSAAAATKRNTLRCRPILFPPPRFYLAGENDDAMKWHEKARYPFQLPQTLFEGTTCTQISNDVPTLKYFTLEFSTASLVPMAKASQIFSNPLSLGLLK